MKFLPNFNLKRHSQEALDRQDGNKNYITHVGNGYQRAPGYQNHWTQQHQNVYQNDRVVPTYDQFFGPPPHTVSTNTIFHITDFLNRKFFKLLLVK